MRNLKNDKILKLRAWDNWRKYAQDRDEVEHHWSPVKEVGLSKEKRIKFRKHVISVAKDIKRYHVKPSEDLTDVKPGKMPYSRRGSERFFMHVRRGNL